MNDEGTVVASDESVDTDAAIDNTVDDGLTADDSAADTAADTAVVVVDESATGDVDPATETTPTTAAPDTIEDVTPGELHAASEVEILVANGTGGRGVAGSVADKLKADGYIANAANAPSTAEAVIYYRVGYDADARAIAAILGAPPEIITPAPADGTIGVAPEAISDGRLASANVVVIVGDDNNIPVG